MKDLRGRIVIITGASRGIGPYIAKALAREGANLVLAARDAARLDDTRAACEALGVAASAVSADVTVDADRRRLVEAAERVGPVDVLVNNAGVEFPGSLVELTFDEVDAIFETNLRAPVHLSKLVLPAMLQRRRGAIVHLSSMAGKSGSPYSALYSTTKFGLQGFTESMQFELDGTGVHMATVCPGFVSEAGMWADSGGKAPRMMREVSPEQVARGVLKAIRGSREVLVTSGPIRPLLALAQLAPSIQKPLVKRMGVERAMRAAQAGVAPAPDGERPRPGS
jgi:short-subunit dehydrogenase